MGDYLERVNKFNVELKIKEAQEEVLSLADRFTLEPADFDYYNRFTMILNQADAIYRLTDPYMLVLSQIEEITKTFESIITTLKEVTVNNFYDCMDQLNDEFDKLLVYLSGMIIINSKDQVKGFKDATRNLRKMTSRYVNQFDEKFTESIKSIEEMASTISNEQVRYNGLIEELNESYEEKQEELLKMYEQKISNIESELEEQYEEYKNSLENKIAVIDSTLSEQEQAYEEKLESKINDFFEDKEEIFNKSNSKWNDTFSTLESNFTNVKDDYLTQWNKHIKDIEGIAGALAEHSMAYSFKKIADDERISKKNWNKLTMGGFIFLFIYGIFIFILSFYSPFTWANLTGRLSLGIGIAAFIAYGGRQVSIHGKVERYCRETEIELASLGPYFAEFKDNTEELLKIRLNLAEKFFGKGDLVADSSLKEKTQIDKAVDNYLSPENVKALLELARKLK